MDWTNTMKKLLSFIIVIAIIAAAVPYIDGYFFYQNYVNLIQQFNAENSMKVTLENYQRGWLHSYATLSVPTGDTLNSKAFLQQTISHGPLVYSGITKGYTFAMANIESIANSNDKMIALLGNPGPKGLANIQTLARFGQYYINHISIFPISINYPGFGKLAWQGLESDISFQVKNELIKNIKTNTTLGALSLDGEMIALSLNTAPITSITESDQQSVGLYDGSTDLSIPSLIIKSADTIMFDLEGAKFIAKMEAEKQSFYNIIYNLDIQKINYPSFTIPLVAPFKLHSSIVHLNTQGVKNLVSYYRSVDLGTNKEEQLNQLEALLPKLITLTTSLNIDFFAETSLGAASIKAKFAWPINQPAPQTMKDVTDHAEITMDTRIAAPLLTALVEADLKSNTPTVATPTPPAPALQPELSPDKAMFNQQVADFVRKGQIPMSIALQIMDMWDKQLTVQAFATDIQQYRLGPEVEAQLIRLYSQKVASQNVAQSSNAPAITTASAQPQTPAQPTDAQAQIQQWLDQGSIVQEKNEYHSVIIRQGGVWSVNGKPAPNFLPSAQ